MLEPQPASSAADPESALPSVGARIAAFAAILVLGIVGGQVGNAFMRVQCSGDCTVPRGLGVLTGTLVAAIGTAVIDALALRALAEGTAGAGRRT